MGPIWRVLISLMILSHLFNMPNNKVHWIHYLFCEYEKKIEDQRNVYLLYCGKRHLIDIALITTDFIVEYKLQN